MYGGERGIRTPGTTFGGTHDFQSRSLGQLGHLSSLISQLDVKYESIAYSPLWAAIFHLKTVSIKDLPKDIHLASLISTGVFIVGEERPTLPLLKNTFKTSFDSFRS